MSGVYRTPPLHAWTRRRLQQPRPILTQTFVAAPGVPTDVTVTDSTNTTLTLGWAAPVTGGPASSYDVRIDGGPPVNVPAGTSATFTDLAHRSSYLLEVRARGYGGLSAYVPVTGLTDPDLNPEPETGSDLLEAAGYPGAFVGNVAARVWLDLPEVYRHADVTAGAPT